MRITIIILSIIGLLLNGFIASIILLMSSAWDGKASISFAILLSLVGFAAIAFGSIFGYYKNWYKAVAVLGSILLTVTSYPWFSENAEWAGFGMLIVAALTTLDACKNH